MTYETFDKVVNLVKSWRERNRQETNEWPDSRDPDFREMISEFKVVPQEVEKALGASGLETRQPRCLPRYVGSS